MGGVTPGKKSLTKNWRKNIDDEKKKRYHVFAFFS
jgi:hypothetical protein